MAAMKKTFDAVAVMREAREKLTREWQDKPREEEIQALRRKFAGLPRSRKHVGR